MNLNEMLKLAGLPPKPEKLTESDIEIHFSSKSDGGNGDICVLDANADVGKLAAMLGIPDGWKPTQIGGIWAAFNSGDRLTFAQSKSDLSEDGDEDEDE